MKLSHEPYFQEIFRLLDVHETGTITQQDIEFNLFQVKDNLMTIINQEKLEEHLTSSGQRTSVTLNQFKDIML